MESFYNDIENLEEINSESFNSKIIFSKEIELKNVNYRYPKETRVALKNINLKIPVCSTVGIVGSTGSGKTTTVDIILGLLEPQKGYLYVDGKIINRNSHRAWQQLIGYVPQNIYLSDDTIAANIAYGTDEENINLEAVEYAAKVANLHSFVINELPNQYQTFIGERGVRLSEVKDKE